MPPANSPRADGPGRPIRRIPLRSTTYSGPGTERSTSCQGVSGSYEELAPQAVVVEVDGQQVWIESIADLLTTLTGPRRQKDRGRVEQLRAIQRAGACR